MKKLVIAHEIDIILNEETIALYSDKVSFVLNSSFVQRGIFAGEQMTEADEMSALADALYNGDTMVVDSEGVVHLDGGASGVSNGTRVSDGTFAGEQMTEADEMSALADALYNGDTMVVDSEGVVHLDGGASGVSNGTRVSDGTFAGEQMTEADEMSELADALYNGDTMVVDSEGVVHLDGGASDVSNGTRVSDGTFAGEQMTEADEMSALADALYNGDTMVVDSEGVVHLDGGESGVSNGTRVSDGTFAAAVVIPSDPNQWYNKNPRLFRTEVAAMNKRYPKAKYSFFSTTSNMYWTIELKISDTGFSKPWTFVLVYDRNHPHNLNFGGSIKACPIKPNEKDIRQLARDHARPGVPHLLHDPNLGTYLCTRRTEDVKDGTREANTAVSVAAWAADWAVHFEVGIRDKRVWNKWCNDTHFKHLMI